MSKFKPSKDSLSLFLLLHFLLSMLFFPVASQLQFGEKQIVPLEAIYSNFSFFPSYESCLVLYGIRNLILIFLYIAIFRNLFTKYKAENLNLTLFQMLLIFFSLLTSALTPPFTSNDFYYYLGIGRLQVYQNLNPYLVGISQTPNPDLTASIGIWVNIPTMYAPLLVYFFKIVSSISDNLIANGLILKFLIIISYFFTSYFTFKISESYKQGTGRIVSLMFLLNPLAIDEILINGHNDIFAILAFLMAVYLCLNSKYIFSFVLLFVAAIFKFPFILFLPLFLIFPRKSITNTEIKNRFQFFVSLLKLGAYNYFRYLLPGFLILTPLLFFFYFQYFLDPLAFKAFSILKNLWNSTTPSLIAVLLNELFQVPSAKVLKVVSLFKIGLVAWVFFRVTKIKDTNTFLEEVASLWIMFYLVFSLYVWPWYWVVVIPFMFFKKSGNYLLHLTAVLIGYTGFWIFFHWYGESKTLSILELRSIEYTLSYLFVLLLFLFPFLEKKIRIFFKIDFQI